MPPIPFKYVVSFSSQDVKYPAENMVKGISTHKWLTDPGDRSGRLEGVFQLDRSSVIDHIDIGAFMCLTVEVLVGRSSWPQGHEYHSLLPSSIFCTPAELKKETSRRCVKMFDSQHFSINVRQQPWDRIKVICSQSLRKDVQFGLCFLRIVGQSAARDSSAAKPEHELNGHSIDARVRGGAPSPATEVIKTHFYGGKHDRSSSQSAPSRWSRAGQMVFAAAGSTPGPRAKSYSASDALAASQEDHHRKTFEGEIMSYLKKRNLQLIDLDKGLDYTDLRHQFEKARMHKLTPEEKESFVEVTNRYFSTLSESPKRSSHTSGKRFIPDDQDIVSLDDVPTNDSIFSSLNSNSNGLISRLHPSVERKTESKVEIYRDQPHGFDIHATVNGSPIKTIVRANKKTLVSHQTYSAKKKFTFVSTPRGSSTRLSDNVDDQSVPSLCESGSDLLSPTTKSLTTPAKESLTFSPIYSVNGQSHTLTTPGSQPRKKLFFKKITPSNSCEKNAEDGPKSAHFKDIFGVTPTELKERTQSTPAGASKSCSKRKLLDDVDTNDVWLSKDKIPPPRITKKHPRHSDIIPLSSDESAELPDLEQEQKHQDLPQCPICMSHFPAAELEQHAAACARVAFGDGKSRIPDTPPCGSKPQDQDVTLLGSLSGDNLSEPSVECPICGNFFLDSKIQEHANQCADMCQAAFT